uniref:Uncharacterized protein n=1 Tax=Glossina austeni TaxID=7395 RepID=A0A1A9V1H9_GLOAU
MVSKWQKNLKVRIMFQMPCKGSLLNPLHAVLKIGTLDGKRLLTTSMITNKKLIIKSENRSHNLPLKAMITTLAINCCKTQTQQEMHAYTYVTSINRKSYKKANDRTQCMQSTLRSSPRDTLANPYLFKNRIY